MINSNAALTAQRQGTSEQLEVFWQSMLKGPELKSPPLSNYPSRKHLGRSPSHLSVHKSLDLDREAAQNSAGLKDQTEKKLMLATLNDLEKIKSQLINQPNELVTRKQQLYSRHFAQPLLSPRNNHLLKLDNRLSVSPHLH